MKGVFYMKNTRKMVTASVLIALYLVLGYLTIDLKLIKISISSLPLVIGGIMMGPWMGLAIGLIGSFLSQMLHYGITSTTILWMIPIASRGLVVGLYAKKHGYQINQFQTTLIMIISSLIASTLYTGAFYVDSKVWDYYSFAVVFGSSVGRFVTGVITAGLLSMLVPVIVRALRSLELSQNVEGVTKKSTAGKASTWKESHLHIMRSSSA